MFIFFFPPSRPQTPPTASSEALDFLRSISAEEVKESLFGDGLVTISDTGKELGEFSITVEPTRHKGQDCLLVHANSHGTIDSVPMGTSVTAYVTHNLKTLEQQHHEYVKLEDNHLDKKTFVTIQDGQYIMNRIVSQGENTTRTEQTFSVEAMNGFISEGSNLLLQRVMIKKGENYSNLNFLSFDSEAALCTASYKNLEERHQKVGESDVTVQGIERTIHSFKGLPTSWQSYYLSDGHLTSRVQVGSPVMMRLLALPPPIHKDEQRAAISIPRTNQLGGRHAAVFKVSGQKSKMKNIEVDKEGRKGVKEELKGDHATYMKRHPELKALLADFLQFLLLRKPEDVVAFAADYFASFSSTTKSGSAYATSNEARFVPRPESPFKKSQMQASYAS
ncbi:putative ciliogenesis-associated TTC17-interacting protein [Apostichopus japonicus]|uniref:Ciliogenesis-associated TTC17-interacting protein n=1 Tax=Stichopus japonicus TaxID=307972 RepID=A0A2G8JRT5_STIJA|nr:putative ciliogenesis-associated TTC17-interacting protein [Apostichopus japonicus]